MSELSLAHHSVGHHIHLLVLLSHFYDQSWVVLDFDGLACTDDFVFLEFFFCDQLSVTFTFTDLYSRWSSQVIDKDDFRIVLEPCLPYHGIDYGQQLNLLSQIQALESTDDFVAFGRTAPAFKGVSIALVVVLSVVAADFLSLFNISENVLIKLVLSLIQVEGHTTRITGVVHKAIESVGMSIAWISQLDWVLVCQNILFPLNSIPISLNW